MRLPRFRFTVRALLLVIALVALVIGVEWARRRWRTCRDAAALYAEWEAENNGLAERFEDLATGPGNPEEARRMAAEYRKLATWAAGQRRRYEAAARTPWASVPRPEEPDFSGILR